ncbi:MAG: hypothetical protein COB38_04630 [Gammaproteobacteria bacterium]|nr:MAG: hypothetical protein COB38_04630 [Gammaproteobacteria bacterium]
MLSKKNEIYFFKKPYSLSKTNKYSKKVIIFHLFAFIFHLFAFFFVFSEIKLYTSHGTNYIKTTSQKSGEYYGQRWREKESSKDC